MNEILRFMQKRDRRTHARTALGHRREIKIAITHLWHAMEPQTIYHLIVKDKVAEQHIQ